MTVKSIIISAALACLTVTTQAQQLFMSDVETYTAPGQTVSLNDNWSISLAGTNVNLVSTTITNWDVAIAVTPGITNGVLRVKNTSSTNTANYVKLGAITAANTTNYEWSVMPGEVLKGRFLPGIDGLLHAVTYNSTQTITYFWSNN